ncbi:MAG: DUF4199 domain-containing protein [Bacteroidota bacterium]
MKSSIIKYGIYSLLTASVLFLAGLVFGKDLSYSTQAIFGYASMVVSLVFVFFGIKHYRDQVNEGVISFRKAFIIGVCITLFAAIGFGIVDYIYTTVINPEFMTQYIEAMKASGATEEIPEYGSVFLAVVMFMTVLVIGIIMTILSSLILSRK